MIIVPTPERHYVRLDLTDYELSALRLLVQTEIDRSARDYDGPQPDTRDWPSAMRALATELDASLVDNDNPDGAIVAAATVANHHLRQVLEDQERQAKVKAKSLIALCPVCKIWHQHDGSAIETHYARGGLRCSGSGWEVAIEQA